MLLGDIEAVLKEMQRQVELFGVQHLPNGTGKPIDEVMLQFARSDFELERTNDMLTWRSVLKEEYHEVLAETNNQKLKTELIQVAAVALSWVRDLGGI